jgi:xanthine phosphoribosyltransferase
MNEKEYYSYSNFVKDAKKLSQIAQKEQFDTLLAVARGGLTLAHFMGIAMDCRQVFAINSIHYQDDKKLDYIKLFNVPDLKDAKRVLIVDDIVDSGDTIEAILQLLKSKYPTVLFKVGTIYYKKSAKLKPDFAIKEATKWIEFFWEVDIK